MTVTPDDRLLVDPDPALAGAIAKTFGLAANAVDVIAPEVGGGFAKLNVYADEILVSYASMQLGRPVKYTESRRESPNNTIQAEAGWQPRRSPALETASSGVRTRWTGRHGGLHPKLHCRDPVPRHLCRIGPIQIPHSLEDRLRGHPR